MEHPSNIIVFSIFLGQNSRTMFLWKYPEDKNVPTNRLLTNYTQKLFSYYKHKTWKLHSKCSVIMVNDLDGVLIFGYMSWCFVKGFFWYKNIPLLALKYELIVSSSFCHITVHRNLWRVVAFWLNLCSCCNILAH